ncbi:MAG: CoA transferase [Burkholderiaceae bacterium]|nr:CoA transferase [Burkholderiaceae bacterium]
MGPLTGISVVEFAGLGPGPFCAMMLADLGADVVRIDRRPGGSVAGGVDVLARGRRSIVLDLKKPEGVDAALRLAGTSDVLIEGFRPGVMEGLGLGPDACLGRNPRLVYGRVTGWGQDGPLAHTAGHDIDYIALTGVLHSIARKGERPVPPPGFVGDFGGAGMLLAFGIVCALLEARGSGKGQVIDASVCDGSALLAALIYGWRSKGFWEKEAGVNMGDGGAPFYDTYRCADGRYVAVGAIEPQFYRLLVEKAGLPESALDAQWDRERWPELKEQFAAVFRTRSRDQWCASLEGTDACFAPVLDLDEAPGHPHNRVRRTFATVDGIVQPSPAPRFSRTPAASCRPVGLVGGETLSVLRSVGFDDERIGRLIEQGVAWQHP